MKVLPVYRPKNTLIHGLHPLASIFLVLSVLTAVLIFQNPLYLAATGLGVAFLVLLAEVGGEMRSFLRLGLFMAVAVAAINPLVNHQGEHILVYGPRVPVWGRLDITLEALVYGAISGFRLFLIVALFGWFSLALNPDDLLDILSRLSLRSSLSAALAVRLYPSLVTEAGEMREVQAARGERLEGGGRRERIKAHFPLWMALLQGSLDRAACIAESMSARGFGSGKVTKRRRHVRPRDVVFALLSLAAPAAAVLLAVRGRGTYQYFPYLSNPFQSLDYWVLLALGAEFGCMVIIGRLWKKWPWWRSRI